AYRPMPSDAEVGNTTPATADELNAAAALQGSDEQPADGAVTDMTTAQDAAPPAVTAPDTTAQDDATAPGVTAQDDTASDPAGTDDTRTAAIDRSGMTEVPAMDVRADDLIGTTVYGAGDENVGSIADVILSSDGQVDAVTVDVGGFLGIGA